MSELEPRPPISEVEGLEHLVPLGGLVMRVGGGAGSAAGPAVADEQDPAARGDERGGDEQEPKGQQERRLSIHGGQGNADPAGSGSLYCVCKESYTSSMNSSRISEKGQVTVPKPLRDALGISPGDRLDFELDGETIRIRKRPDLDRLAAMYGSLKLPASVDELIDEMRGGADRL